MITVGMNYHVIEGKQADFEEKFAAVLGALREAEGHDNSTLWKDVDDGASYLITSEWSDQEAFMTFHPEPGISGSDQLGQRANSLRPAST